MRIQKDTQLDTDSSNKSMDPKLYLAASMGDSHYIKRLITDETGYCQAQFTPQSNSLLHIAISSQQTELVRTLIQLCPCLLPHQNSHGDTPLHLAAKIGCLETVRLLVDDGVPAHQSRETLSLNYDAPSPGDSSLLRKLNGSGDSALHLAVRSGRIGVVELLVTADSQLMYMDNKMGETPVFVAIEAGFFDIARYLILQMPPSPSSSHYKGANGLTALHAALIRTHHGRALENHVPDLSLENIRRIMRDRLLSLHELVKRLQSSQIDIIKELVNKWPHIVTEADEYGRTPLHYAAHLGHLEATKHLLQLDPSVVYSPSKEGTCAFHVAAKQGHIKIMDELTNYCPDVHELLDRNGRTALHVAVVSGRTRVVKYILGNNKFQGIINFPDEEGNTPLHLAAACWKDDILMALACDTRVDKKAVNKQHCKPIDILHSNTFLGELVKTRIMKMMEQAGSRQSLRSVIREQADTRRFEPYSENNDVKAGDLHGSNSFSERDISLHLYNDRSSLERSSSGTMSLSDNSSRSIRLKGISETHLLVAALIATVTFTAGLTVPGGFKNQGRDEGTAELVSKAAFKIFLIANALAFYCSTFSVFLHFLTSVEHNFHLLLRFTKFAAVLTYFSILSLMIAFTSGMRVILPEWGTFSIGLLAMGCCFVVLCLFGFI